MVFDILHATDSRFQVRPQVVEGHDVGGLTWTMRLIQQPTMLRTAVRDTVPASAPLF